LPAASPPDVGVVIVAAGAGVRAGPGEPKQFRPIHGVPLLLRALRPFTSHPEVEGVIIALPAGIADHPPDWLAKLRGPRLEFVTGGATRADSVRVALSALPDQARVDAVIARARAGVGAVAAVAVSDTIKQVSDGAARVARTVPREGLWRAQTPQGFPRRMLEQAYARLRRGDAPPTDDAELCERAGFPVEVVTDSPHNLKVTTPDDFRLAEALARELR
jgi:2-C-methyl-D-erythritol 4-phosphate cytidylyltransferase